MDKKEFCKVTVHWETKATGKKDTRILILRSDRLDVAILKGQLRVERTVHFLDIRRVDVGEENSATITLTGGECLQFACTLEADLTRIVSHLMASLQLHLPQVRTAQQQLVELNLPPSWKLESMISDHLTELGRPAATSDKCGYFGTAYEFFCKYSGTEVRDEIKWDVETIYFSQGCKTFALSDFNHFGQADFAMILAALSFNDHFTVLNADGVKFTPPMVRFIEMMLTYNSTLLELHLSNCGLKLDAVKAIATAIEGNSKCRIKVLDLSSNLFNEDKVVERLSSLLARLSGSLERLNLSSCSLSSKSLNKLCESLSQSQAAPPLRHLLIDFNDQKGDNSTRSSIGQLLKPQQRSWELLKTCIAKATNLEHFSCTGCDFSLDSFASAFIRGLTQCVTHLDLSGNQFNSLRRPSRPKDPPVVSKDWGMLFARCLRLKVIRVNNCRLPPQAVADLLRGLGENQDLKGVSLEMAGNELGVAGAQVLCSCLKSCSIKCLDSLDISDNGFDTELNVVVEAVCRSSIRHLSIGGNNFRLKDSSIVEVFSELVTESKCTLESLSVRDAKLRERLVLLLNAIGQCRNLSKLDITGNGMQALGAKFLAKSLYLNSNLTEVQLDDNQIGLSGLQDITDALQFNSCLRSLPVPAADVAKILAESPGSVAAVSDMLASLQQSLLKNYSATYQVTGRDYRLQSELGTYAFSLDHLAGKLDNGLRALGPCDEAEDPEAAECERSCRAAMRDALSARYLLSRLSEVADSRPADSTERCLRDKLPEPLLDAAATDLTRTQEAMMDFLASECPNAFKVEPGLVETLRKRLGTEQTQVTTACVQGLLEKAAGASLASKLSSLQLNSALLMNDCMQEAIAHNLQQAEQTLSKLMRSKMMQPNLRRADSQKSPEPESPPSATSPQAASQSSTQKQKRGNARPISVFGKKGAGGKLQTVEISSASSDATDASRNRSADVAAQSPQALPPRRPKGPEARRLPTTKSRRLSEVAPKEESEPDDDAGGADDEQEIGGPVFEHPDEDETKSSAQPAKTRKLPAGAVPLMGFASPVINISAPSGSATLSPAVATRPAVAKTLAMPISQLDLSRTVLRRTMAPVDAADGEASKGEQLATSPGTPSQLLAAKPKTKPKPGVKPATNTVSDSAEDSKAPTSMVEEPSSCPNDSATKPSEQPDQPEKAEQP